MGRLTQIEPRFVKFVPEELEGGVVYISIEYGAVVHACCCGCGEKVSTPLSPAQWSLTYNGEQISLSPSVGSGTLPCNSHYVIARNDVRWARSLTEAETAAALRHDAAVVAEHHALVAKAPSSTWWSRIKRRFRPDQSSH